MSEKSDKLKFTDEEVNPEAAKEAEAKPPVRILEPDPDSLIGYIYADKPLENDLIRHPAADHEGGGETPDADASEVEAADTDVNADIEAEAPDETADSKLYERDSSLKFTRDRPVAPEKPKDAPVKKRQRVFGVTDDHSTHDNLINKPVIPEEPAEHDGGETVDAVTVETDANAENPADVEADEPDEADDGADKPDAPAEPDTAETVLTNTALAAAVTVVAPVVAPAVLPAARLIKPKKPVKSASKLKFTKEEKPVTKEDKAKYRERRAKFKEEKRAAKQDDKIDGLEYKTDLNAYKRDKAKAKQPTKRVKVKERVFDEKTGKAKTKLRFEEKPVAFGEAKWNLPKKQSLPVKGAVALTSMGVTKLHQKVHQVEGENVGTQMAHKMELVGESAAHGGKKLIHTTYRHVKNTPFRQAAKFETKTIKSRMKLDYQKAVRDNPKLKSNPLSRFMQKRKIKKQYAAALRKSKKTGEAVKKTGSVVTKVTQAVTKVIRRNPIFLLKIGLILLILFAIMSLFTMCMSIFTKTSGVMGAASYLATEENIEQAALAYTEWETDLRLEILNAETTYSGYDEYIYNVDGIGHSPIALMAFLTAVYHEFEYADIKSVLRGIFDRQYTLEFVPDMEIRQRYEQVGSDPDTGDPIYDWVDYEWHILNVNLTTVPFTGILESLMDDDQKEHYGILIQTQGARQYGGSPFDIVNWIPFVSSHYGYRVHPITGVKDLHRGIDLAMPEGTEIRAGITGTVTTATFDSGYGNYIVIKNADGVEMKYAHCHTLFFSAGQTVEKGDVIATVGNTGSSTGAHLHMEILKDGVYLNPIFFVETFYF